jgi:hypothetical protein
MVRGNFEITPDNLWRYAVALSRIAQILSKSLRRYPAIGWNFALVQEWIIKIVMSVQRQSLCVGHFRTLRLPARAARSLLSRGRE